MSIRRTLVLVVDDDIRMLRMMKRMMELDDHRVVTAIDGETMLQRMDDELPDLVLLDVVMPGIEGYTLCRRVREFSGVPIIMVTAKDSDVEKVRGLDAGADDYVTKPFSARELSARVRAALRRAAPDENGGEPTFRCQSMVVDFARQTVSVDGHNVRLTATEFKVLKHLVRNADRVITPGQLLEKVWGEQYVGDTNLLQANIARLRKKLRDDARNPRFIFTRPGLGYIVPKATRL